MPKHHRGNHRKPCDVQPVADQIEGAKVTTLRDAKDRYMVGSYHRAFACLVDHHCLLLEKGLTYDKCSKILLNENR